MIIRIAILINNESWGNDISRRLTELAGGLEITLINRKDEFAFNDYDIILNENDIDHSEPVSILYERIVNDFYNLTGKKIIGNINSGIQYYTFSSETGGAGATTVSFIFSRLLSMHKDYKTLFIDIKSKRQFFIYSINSSSVLHSSRELEYLLKGGSKINLRNYVIRDNFGPYVLTIQKEVNNLISYLNEHSRLNAIVINYGISCQYQPFGKVIRVINTKDLRSKVGYERESDVIYVFNRADSNRIDNGDVYIMESPESFVCDGKNVSILMDRGMAMGVEKLMERVCDDELC